MNRDQITKFPEPFYYLIFQINSRGNTKLKTLFTDLKSFFENFPVLRWAGWDLKIGTGGRYKIDLEGIEFTDSSKRIKVLENGGLIIQGSLNGNFLCWGGGQQWGDGEDVKGIHSLALIEFTYSSFIALQRILEDVENSTSITAEIGFSGINNEFSLRYNRIGSGNIALEEKFSSNDKDFKENFSCEDLSKEKLSATVYAVTKKIYRMFSLEEREIPYVKENSGEKLIDIQEIKNIN